MAGGRTAATSDRPARDACGDPGLLRGDLRLPSRDLGSLPGTLCDGAELFGTFGPRPAGGNRARIGGGRPPRGWAGVRAGALALR